MRKTRRIRKEKKKLARNSGKLSAIVSANGSAHKTQERVTAEVTVAVVTVVGGTARVVGAEVGAVTAVDAT